MISISFSVSISISFSASLLIMFNSYFDFLFDLSDPDFVKVRHHPRIHLDGNSVVICYDIPGRNSPVQKFRFIYPDIPCFDELPNDYLRTIFTYFEINPTLINRLPYHSAKRSRSYFIRPNIRENKIRPISSRTLSDLEIKSLNNNIDIAVSYGRQNHSLDYFDLYYDSYIILNHLANNSCNRKKVLAIYEKLI